MSKSALEIAREALEESRGVLQAVQYLQTAKIVLENVEAAISALRQPVADEHQAFEQWYSGGSAPSHAFDRSGDGYKYMATHTAWNVWQAARALPHPPITESTAQAVEPVAWMVNWTERFGEAQRLFYDTQKQAEGFVAFNGSGEITPVFAAPVPQASGQQEWNAAIEAAASICDGLAQLYEREDVGFDKGYTMASKRSADEIRALKKGGGNEA